MTLRIAICAIVLASLGFNASATYSWGGGQNAWDNWQQSNDGPSWDGKKLKNLMKKLKEKRNNRWCKSIKQWESDCNWGQSKKWKKKLKRYCSDKPRKCKGKKNRKCDPPTAVPSPTAALAGLGVMGLMLSRRRNKQA